MSRCQHAQKITHFCVTQSCTWKQSAGCQNCMKKYHNHIGKTKYVKQQEIMGIMEKLTVSSEAKAKCRNYQQSLYNYFNSIKNQFSNCIDNLSKLMLHRVGTPFLYQKGYVSIYRRLKARDYRKIGPKQLNPFLNFAKGIQSLQLQSEEKRLYHQEAQESFKIVRELNEVFNLINQVTKKYQTPFDSGKELFAKIQEINKVRQAFYKQPGEKAKVNSAQQKKKQMKDGLNSNISQQTGTTKNNNRSRKVSIDSSFQPIKVPQISKYDQNEKSISSQKEHLINMLNQKRNGQSPQKKKQESHTENMLDPTFDTAQQNKTQSEKIFQIRNVQKPSLESSKQAMSSQFNSFKQEESVNQSGIEPIEKQTDQQNKAKLFDFLLAKGINFPQLVAHTILPQGKQNKKLYEQAEVIKKKTIQIPMNPLPQQQQYSSPLLKKRKTKRQNEFSMGVKKVSNFQNSNDVLNQESYQNIQLDSNTFTKHSVQQATNQQQSQHEIEDNQVNSVALLIQSLHLNIGQAIPILEASLRECRTNLSAAEYLTFLYIQNGQAKECLVLCNQVLQRLEHSHEYQDLSGHLMNNKAAALNLLGRYSQSIGILQKIIAINPKDVCYKNLADAYFSIGIYQKAVFNYEQAIKMNKNFDQAYYNLAVCLYMQENYNNCMHTIENALRLSPQNDNYKELMKNLADKISPTN